MPDVLPMDMSGVNFSPPVMAWRASSLKEKPKGGIATAPYKAMEAKWKKPGARSDGFMNVHDEYNDQDGMVYFGTTATAPCDGTWRLYIGHDGGVKVFVDGKDILTAAKRFNPCLPGRSHADVALSKGKHEIIVAFDLAAGNGWGIFGHVEALGKQRKPKPRFPTFSV